MRKSGYTNALHNVRNNKTWNCRFNKKTKKVTKNY